eukprot:9478767-Pyramimonas_sp.AAC.1
MKQLVADGQISIKKSEKKAWAESLGKRLRTLLRQVRMQKSKPSQWFIDAGFEHDGSQEDGGTNQEDEGGEEEAAVGDEEVDPSDVEGAAPTRRPAATQDFDYNFDKEMGLAYRVSCGLPKALPEYCETLEPPPNAHRTDACIATWKDGTTRKVPEMTVQRYNDSAKPSTTKSSGSGSSSRLFKEGDVIVGLRWDAPKGDKQRLCTLKDGDGHIMQINLKFFKGDEDAMVKWMNNVAQQLYKQEIDRHQCVELKNKFVQQSGVSAKALAKRPAAAETSGPVAKKPAAADASASLDSAGAHIKRPAA